MKKKFNLQNMFINVNNEKINILYLEAKPDKYILYQKLDDSKENEDHFKRIDSDENFVIPFKKKFSHIFFNVVKSQKTGMYELILNKKPVYCTEYSDPVHIENGNMKLIDFQGKLFMGKREDIFTDDSVDENNVKSISLADDTNKPVELKEEVIIEKLEEEKQDIVSMVLNGNKKVLSPPMKNKRDVSQKDKVAIKETVVPTVVEEMVLAAPIVEETVVATVVEEMVLATNVASPIVEETVVATVVEEKVSATNVASPIVEETVVATVVEEKVLATNVASPIVEETVVATVVEEKVLATNVASPIVEETVVATVVEEKVSTTVIEEAPVEETNVQEIHVQSNNSTQLFEEDEKLNIKIKEIAEEIKREKSDLEHVLNKEFTINHIISDFYQLEKDIENNVKKYVEPIVETNVEKDLRKTYKTNFQHNNTNFSINTIKLEPLPKDSNIMKIDVAESNIINTTSLAFEIDSADMNYLILYNNVRYLVNKTGNLIVIINLYNKNIQKIKNKDSLKMLNNDYMLHNNTVFIPMENKKIFNNDYGTSFNLFTPKI
jgi:predicted RNA-binding protein